MYIYIYNMYIYIDMYRYIYIMDTPQFAFALVNAPLLLLGSKPRLFAASNPKGLVHSSAQCPRVPDAPPLGERQKYWEQGGT